VILPYNKKNPLLRIIKSSGFTQKWVRYNFELLTKFTIKKNFRREQFTTFWQYLFCLKTFSAELKQWLKKLFSLVYFNYFLLLFKSVGEIVLLQIFFSHANNPILCLKLKSLDVIISALCFQSCVLYENYGSATIMKQV